MRQRILERLRELEPLVREYNELKQIAGEMGLEPSTGAAAGPGQPRPAGGPAQPRPSSAGGARRRNASARGRSRPAAQRASGAEDIAASGRAPAGGATGQVSERVLEAVRGEPGKTVAEYAQILGVSATTLYRPVRELTNDRVLVKRARQLFPA